jgi:predicted small secreted protein
MKRSRRVVVVTTLVISGFALAGCGTMSNEAQDNSNRVTGATTSPTAQNNSAPPNGASSNGTDNSYIGNGAFGEAP